MKCQFLLVLLACEAALADYGEFRHDYKYYEAVGGWMKLHRSPVTWSEAREVCQKEGSVLASPLDVDLEAAMQVIMGEKAHVIYTGISNIIDRENFFSVEGVSIDEVPASWVPLGSVVDGKGTLHLCIVMYANGSISTQRCSTRVPYVCFKKNSTNARASNRCGTDDPDYVFEESTGSCFKFHETRQTWISAFKTCSREGGYLAIINSVTEAETFKRFMGEHLESVRKTEYNEAICIGIQDWNEEEKPTAWMTIHGQTLKEAGYGQWKNETYSGTHEDKYCGAMDQLGYMFRISCGISNTTPTLCFICEIEPPK